MPLLNDTGDLEAGISTDDTEETPDLVLTILDYGERQLRVIEVSAKDEMEVFTKVDQVIDQWQGIWNTDALKSLLVKLYETLVANPTSSYFDPEDDEDVSDIKVCKYVILQDRLKLSYVEFDERHQRSSSNQVALDLLVNKPNSDYFYRTLTFEQNCEPLT